MLSNISDKNQDLLKDSLEAFAYENDEFRANTVVVRHSYHVPSELSAQKIRQQIDKLVKRFQLFSLEIADNTMISSVLSEKM